MVKSAKVSLVGAPVGRKVSSVVKGRCSANDFSGYGKDREVNKSSLIYPNEEDQAPDPSPIPLPIQI